jgi:hypothetical protein
VEIKVAGGSRGKKKSVATFFKQKTDGRPVLRVQQRTEYAIRNKKIFASKFFCLAFEL